MNRSLKKSGYLLPALLLTLFLVAILFVSSGFAKGKKYTGVVGDALCGLDHSMPVSAVECIRQCIGKGSRYSLIIGDTVYALDTDDKVALDTLEKQAGERVTVTGTDDGKIITVTAVKAAK